ncbi:MAG: hypothetical protein JWN86_1977 [Planctomycetota bacterium]|nr:hypothetical protein [Planctomycetota bacterium]
MNRKTFTFILGTMVLGLAGASLAQVPPPVPGGQIDLNGISHELAQRVRHLGEDIASDLGRTPNGRHLVEDTRELAQTVDEFHESLHNNPNSPRSRQTFLGIDATWQHLRSQLLRPGGSSPAVDRAARRVDELVAQLRQAMGLNAPPPGFYGNAAPTGLGEVRRLAHALEARADALTATLATRLARDPNGPAVLRDAQALTRAADAFHDSVDANPSVEAAARAFAPVDELGDRLERYITASQAPPDVQAAWQSFASVEILIHQALGLRSPQPRVAVSLAPVQSGGPPPIVGLANQLVDQTNAFLQVFGPTAGTVPQGGLILAEAQRLQAAAVDFQHDAARGLPPNQLAFEFRETDASWQRLARRVNRIAQGRIGPNITQVQKIGQTCEQIHRVLGMPGYAPIVVLPAR